MGADFLIGSRTMPAPAKHFDNVSQSLCAMRHSLRFSEMMRRPSVVWLSSCLRLVTKRSLRCRIRRTVMLSRVSCLDFFTQGRLLRSLFPITWRSKMLRTGDIYPRMCVPLNIAWRVPPTSIIFGRGEQGVAVSIATGVLGNHYSFQ